MDHPRLTVVKLFELFQKGRYFNFLLTLANGLLYLLEVVSLTQVCKRKNLALTCNRLGVLTLFSELSPNTCFHPSNQILDVNSRTFRKFLQ